MKLTPITLVGCQLEPHYFYYVNENQSRARTAKCVIYISKNLQIFSWTSTRRVTQEMIIIIIISPSISLSSKVIPEIRRMSEDPVFIINKVQDRWCQDQDPSVDCQSPATIQSSSRSQEPTTRRKSTTTTGRQSALWPTTDPPIMTTLEVQSASIDRSIGPRARRPCSDHLLAEAGDIQTSADTEEYSGDEAGYIIKII